MALFRRFTATNFMKKVNTMTVKILLTMSIALGVNNSKLLAQKLLPINLSDYTDLYQSNVTSVCFSNDGKFLATGHDWGKLKIWNLNTGVSQKSFYLHHGSITGIGFSKDDRFVISCSLDGTIKIVDVASGRVIKSFNSSIGPIFSFDMSSDGKIIAFGGQYAAKLMKLETGDFQQTLSNLKGSVSSISLDKTGTKVATGESGYIRVWNTKTNDLIISIKQDTNLLVNAVSFSPDGYFITNGSSVWELSSGKRVIDNNCSLHKIRSASYCPNSLSIGVTQDNDLFLFNTKYRIFKKLYTCDKVVNSIAFSNDGRFLASSCTGDGFIKVFQIEQDLYSDKLPKPIAPANLDISSLKFVDSLGNNNQLMDARENAFIQFLITNTGKGDAYQLKANITMSKTVMGLDYPKTFDIGDLEAGKSTSVTIPVSGTIQLEAAKAEFTIDIKEGNGFDADPFIISFNTQAFKSPLLTITDHKFSSDEAGKIRLGQTVSLQIMLQNKGQGEAKDIKVDVVAPENVFPANESVFYIDKLLPNESKILHYEFFANKKYIGSEIPIKVNITESYKRYGDNKTLSVSLDQNLPKTQLVEIVGVSDKPININSIYLTSDVNRDIPIGTTKQPNTFALIIGNEDYSSYQKGISSEMNVAYAKNDALTFKEYCSKTLGIPEENITCILDATAGKMWQEIDRLSKLIEATNGKASIILYYAGHGLPDEQTKAAYLIPVDVSGSNISSAIKLSTVYEKLSEYPSKQVTVFLDACFTGGARNGALLASRAIRITPKSDYLKGNIVVFTASSGDESALPWKAQQHGMFTYFLLKKLQQTKGDLNFNELRNYLKENVSLESVRTNSKKQTPQVLISPDLEQNWGSLKLK